MPGSYAKLARLARTCSLASAMGSSTGVGPGRCCRQSPAGYPRAHPTPLTLALGLLELRDQRLQVAKPPDVGVYLGFLCHGWGGGVGSSGRSHKVETLVWILTCPGGGKPSLALRSESAVTGSWGCAVGMARGSQDPVSAGFKNQNATRLFGAEGTPLSALSTPLPGSGRKSL